MALTIGGLCVYTLLNVGFDAEKGFGPKIIPDNTRSQTQNPGLASQELPIDTRLTRSIYKSPFVSVELYGSTMHVNENKDGIMAEYLEENPEDFLVFISDPTNSSEPKTIYFGEDFNPEEKKAALGAIRNRWGEGSWIEKARIRKSRYETERNIGTFRPFEQPDESLNSPRFEIWDKERLKNSLFITLDPESTTKCDGNLEVVPERTLSSTEQTRLCSAAIDMSPFVKDSLPDAYPEMTYFSGKHVGMYSSYNNAFRLSLPLLENTDGYELDTLETRHELAHAVFNDSSLDENIELRQSFASLSRAMTYEDEDHFRAPHRYDTVANEPVWRILAERFYIDTYTKTDPSLLGHPNDNSNELFASTTNVLRIFPEEFIYQFNQLNSKQKAAVAQTVRAVLGIYNSIDEKAAKNLFPAFDALHETVAADTYPHYNGV